MLSGQITGARAVGYGTGMGRVLRMRSEPLLAAAFVAYDLARTMIVAAKGDWTAASLCLRHAQGISAGFFAHLAPAPSAPRIPAHAASGDLISLRR